MIKASFVILELKIIFKLVQTHNYVCDCLIGFLVCFLVASSNCLLVVYKCLKDVFKGNDKVVSYHGLNVIGFFMVVPVLFDMPINVSQCK